MALCYFLGDRFLSLNSGSMPNLFTYSAKQNQRGQISTFDIINYLKGAYSLIIIK